ncbi:hypothetical protein QJS04_geneDACA012058 [Acorus gramineus]|uniref:Uncharacterized protein n=1 Tax=Acorus gramineus TaxID=55184 RepID=A0AAV9BBC0_ACOGR|nr:hypothetical protein QJS04_geneDACA012058 [Acorus gramineus]
MAASSPVLSNNSSETRSTLPVNNGSLTPQRSTPIDAPKNLRGLNKPKCIKCGNVARSRCPYQSCKSCCAKAQNPCHIHVLRPNATFPDKAPPSSSPLFDQPSTDKSPASSSSRMASFRQLSSTFAQFRGIQVSSRGRRPLSRKDAIAINAWRFSKLKEYTERNLEAENEAFDRYMQNVSLLDEAFSPSPLSDGLMGEDENRKEILTMKARLRSSAQREDSCRERLRNLVNQGLDRMKAESCDEGGSPCDDDVDDHVEIKKPKKVDKWRAERAEAVDDLIVKLNKARSKDDLQSCLEMKLQLFDPNVNGKCSSHSSEAVRPSCEENAAGSSSRFSLAKLWNSIEVDQECLANIDTQFSSLGEVENL